jgi:hypothetical protein
MSTQLTGTYSNCGFGGGFSAKAICTGPGCDILSKFPAFACRDHSGTFNCTNSVTCTSTPDVGVIESNFTINQVGSGIVDKTQLQIANNIFSATRTVTATVTYPPSATATTTSRGRKSTSPSAIISFLAIVLILIPLVHAQSSPPSPEQIAQNIFSGCDFITILPEHIPWGCAESLFFAYFYRRSISSRSGWQCCH